MGGFFGLPPSANPTVAGNWAQMASTIGNMVISVPSASEKVARFQSSGCASASCSLASSSQSGSWVTALTYTSAGSYALTFASGTFSSNPSCVASATGTSGGLVTVIGATPSGITSITVENSSTHGALDRDFNLICMGPQ